MRRTRWVGYAEELGDLDWGPAFSADGQGEVRVGVAVCVCLGPVHRRLHFDTDVECFLRNTVD